MYIHSYTYAYIHDLPLFSEQRAMIHPLQVIIGGDGRDVFIEALDGFVSS